MSPIGPNFFSERGLRVLLSELRWIWVPSALFVAAVSLRRRGSQVGPRADSYEEQGSDASIASVCRARCADRCWSRWRGTRTRSFGFGFDEPVRWAPSDLPDRNFTVCRIMYTSVRREPNGGGWRTDYPYGEINLMTRLSELTKTPVSFNGARSARCSGSCG